LHADWRAAVLCRRPYRVYYPYAGCAAVSDAVVAEHCNLLTISDDIIDSRTQLSLSIKKVVSQEVIMIRKAESEDKKYVTKLHYMAGPNLIKYFFACDNDEKACTILDLLYESNETIFSKEYFFLFEENDKVKGAISLFSGGKKKSLEKNIGNYGKEIFKITGVINSIKMMFRTSLNKAFPSFYNDELYIEAISLFPEYRGQSIASKLLKHSFEYAEKLNIPKVALLVEIQNEHALNIYKKYGFNIVSTHKFKRKCGKHKLIGVHKMIAEVD
jgi:RimJ/RimL family protein N-acetyltransferase